MLYITPDVRVIMTEEHPLLSEPTPELLRQLADPEYRARREPVVEGEYAGPDLFHKRRLCIGKTYEPMKSYLVDGVGMIRVLDDIDLLLRTLATNFGPVNVLADSEQYWAIVSAVANAHPIFTRQNFFKFAVAEAHLSRLPAPNRPTTELVYEKFEWTIDSALAAYVNGCRYVEVIDVLQKWTAECLSSIVEDHEEMLGELARLDRPEDKLSVSQTERSLEHVRGLQEGSAIYALKQFFQLDIFDLLKEVKCNRLWLMSSLKELQHA